jgi:type III pantothenate kinase
MTDRYFGFQALVVGPGVKTGVAVLTDNPREVGADRVANAAAAHDLFPGEAAVVVDFGTATTVDAVSSRGDLLGCAIAPGLEIAANSLFQGAAQIQRVELVAPPTAIGKSTTHSVQSGVLFGFAALVDGLVDRVLEELGRARVVATGGLAPTVMDHCRRVEQHEPALTLIGLHAIFERNATA